MTGILLMGGMITAFLIWKGNRENEEDVLWNLPVVMGETDEEESKGDVPTEEIRAKDIFTEEEKCNLRQQAVSQIEACAEFYMDVEIMNPESEYYYMFLSDETCQKIVERLGKQGFVSVSECTNMENYEAVENFYSDYLERIPAQVTLYNIGRNGLITAQTFRYQDEKLQFCFTAMKWTVDKKFEMIGSGVNHLEKIILTEKGYFIYENENIIEHANLREYYRVRPLSDECREMTEKYISGLSYLNYNMLTTSWDEDNVEDILMPCMFEDIYRIYSGENLKVEGGKIPAEMYEKIMLSCFQVSPEQIREHCGYDDYTDSYNYEMLYAKPYPPFGEVVDFIYHTDGAITLYVDAVWPDYEMDCAFKNEIVVKPGKNGTFCYLSNKVMFRDPKADTLLMMERVGQIYESADKSDGINREISDETVEKMMSIVGKSGYPVTASDMFSIMANYEKMEDFLCACKNGKAGGVVVYEIHTDGGIQRKEFSYNHEIMYLSSIKCVWNRENKPVIADISNLEVKYWNYTEKGWFQYTLLVPEPPVVSEVIHASCLMRVKPWDEVYFKFSKDYLFPIGYQGNNLFCSEWNPEHMENIDYTGLYEFLYYLEYGEPFKAENSRVDIPKAKFETLMTSYLPVDGEQLRKYAAYNEKNQTYAWERLSCMNYIPESFWTSFPEVTKISENIDGTLTVTIDAVCEALGNDRVMRHELVVRVTEDGSIQYVRNSILDDGISQIPDYQYRLKKEVTGSY